MIFKLHYGLWYGALVGIIPFMFNYAAHYSGASGAQHGILYTVLPFVALLAKPIVCSYADKYAAHHHCLLLFIFLTILGFGSLAVYPFFPDLVNNHKDILWILYCLGAFVGNTSMCVVNSIGDSMAVNSCQRKNVSYGQYRLWGPVGFGIFGAIWGISNEILHLPKYTPGIITMVIILIINGILLAFWYDKDEFKVLSTTKIPLDPLKQDYNSGDDLLVKTNNNAKTALEAKKVKQLSLLWQLACRELSIHVFIFIFAFCGVMTGIHWQFFFKYLQKVAEESHQSFSLVATFVLPVQALGGELVFFMLASKILKKLGSSLTLVICLFSITARYLLYAYVIPHINIYWILLVELLQGPAFGLMYCVLTHQANLYSEKIDEIVAESSSSDSVELKNSLHATLQGILGASFEGLGLGLGAIIGGLSYDKDLILMWQIGGYSALVVLITYLLGLITTLALRRSPRRRSSDVHL